MSINVYTIKKDEMRKCFEAVGENKAIMCHGELMTDYQFANLVHDYIIKPHQYTCSNCNVRVKSPYVIITDIFSFKEKLEDFANLFGIPQDAITCFDVSMGYEYVINCKELLRPVEAISWDPKEFLDSLIELSKSDDVEGVDIDAIIKVLRSNLYGIDEETMIAVEIEERVLAMAVDNYIPDAKEEFSRALGVDKELMIEVSGPSSTVILIDGEKIHLLSEYCSIGVEEWLI